MVRVRYHNREDTYLDFPDRTSAIEYIEKHGGDNRWGDRFYITATDGLAYYQIEEGGKDE